ncbi:MAG: CU044_5270 family protein [Actinomycetota bacterium]
MNDLLPAPPDRELTAKARFAIKTVVMSDIAPTATRGTRRALRPKGPQARSKSLFAAVAAVLVIVLVVPVVLTSGNGGAPSASARVLTRAARAAAEQPPLKVGRDEFFHRTQMSTGWLQTQGFAISLTIERQSWVAPDGAGGAQERLIDMAFDSPEEEARWNTEGREIHYWGNFSILGKGGATSQCFQPSGLLLENLNGLPTDPDALEEMLRDQIIQGDIADSSVAKQTNTMFEEIGFKLSYYPGSPEIRSALFEVLARQPGIEVLGQATDHLGRTGIAIGSTWLGVRSEMIVDTSTGAILETRSVQVDPKSSLVGGTPGTPAPDVGVNADGVDDPGTSDGWSTVAGMDVVKSLPPIEHPCSDGGFSDPVT